MSEPYSVTPVTARRRAAPTIGEKLKSRENNFDFLRLIAAIAVIISHSFPIRDGHVDKEPFHRLSGYCTLGEVAVGVFFIISGMLVARSFLSDPHPLAYLKKRSLRIFPGLVVCVIFCMFVMGPIFTTEPLQQYFHDKQTLLFARNAVLYPNHYWLGGVFTQFPDARGDVNGSLWSLPIEFMMYIAILALGMWGLLKRRGCVILIATILIFEWLVVERLGLAQPNERLHKYRVWIESTPQMGFLFFGGTLMLLFKDSIVLDWRIFAACLAIIVFSWDGPFVWFMKTIGHPGLVNPDPRGWWHTHGFFLLSICLPYVVMYLAFLPLPALQSVTKWGDFSYGIYLYGFPVQQMIYRTWGPKIPFPLFIVLACIGATLLAVLSWYLVEKPFLRLKKRTTRPHPPERDGDEPQAKQPVTVQRQFSLVRQVVFFV